MLLFQTMPDQHLDEFCTKVTHLTILLVLLLAPAKGDTFLLEAEQYVKDRMAYPRTTASGIWAVHFFQNEVSLLTGTEQ